MSDEIAMTAIVGGRGSGKTTRMLEWLADGEIVGGYPHWSKVILTTTIEQAIIVRDAARERYPDKDVWRCVFSIDEWKHAHGVPPEVEVAIDNADAVLQRFAGPHRLARVSMTCKVDDPVSRAEGAPTDG